MKNEELRVILDATNVCNRGCGHCMFDSKMSNRCDFSIALARKLASELADSSFEVITIEITGGGEPLLNQSLPEIIRILWNALYKKKDVRFIIITSGCTFKDLEEVRLVRELLGIGAGRVTFCLSFSLYLSSSPVRLASMLTLFKEVGYPLSFFLKVSVGPADIFKTLAKAEEVLVKNEEGLFVYLPAKVKYFHLIDEPFIEDLLVARACAVLSDPSTIPFMFFRFRGRLKWRSKKWGKIILQKVKYQGRAKELPEDSIWNKEPEHVSCAIWRKQDDITFSISSRGDFMPFAGCREQGKIGSLQESSLDDLFKRREEIVSRLPVLLLADRVLNLSDCERCQRIISEHFDLNF